MKGEILWKEVIKLFKQIQETSSTNDKKAIISANKDNELFKKCLVFLLDGNINTGLSAKKIAKKVTKSEYILPTFEDVMKYLAQNNTGTDNDISMIQAFLDEHEEDREFYEQMITKSFRLGADSKVINSVIPGLIPTFEVQQAYPLSEKNEPKDGEWFALSQKLNGNNCSYYNGKLISRQGKEFIGLQHIIDDIEKLPNHENFFFNGELMRKNTDNISDDQNFQIGTGIINSENEDKSCIYFNIYEGTDKSKIKELLKEFDSKGFEGLMLNKDTKWKNKRNNGILKVKSFKHADILCTDVVEGDGKYKGTLGLIKCDYKGYELGVGSGFTDEQRDYYWNNKEEIIDKIVQIKYKGETKNKQGGLSVQFPIFEIVRNDKNEVSYN